MLDFVPLLLAVLATFRITSLIVEDTITNPLREFWWRRFPTRGFYYEAFRVTPSDEVDNAGTVRAWPFTRSVRRRGAGQWDSQKSYKLGELIECPYCVSVWVAAGMAVFLNEILSLPYTADTFLNFLAIAGGAELLNNRFGRE